MARVLILQDNGLNESLALTELSALLQQHGHSTWLILRDHERRPQRAIREYDPQLIVIPCPVTGDQEALALAGLAREAAPQALTLMGGTHASFSPELARDERVDLVCIGEAEASLVQLAARLDQGGEWSDIPNLCWVQEGLLHENPVGPLWKSLDELPMPDRDLYYRYGFIGRFGWKRFATGRGCMHGCLFCWNSAVAELYQGKGPFVRRKSPERAVAEILAVRERHPITSIHFSDDLFTVHPQWLEDFASIYPERVGIPFTCNSSIELLSERVVTALAAAGCRGVAVGIETGSEELRSKILGKHVSNDLVRRAAARIKGAGMELTTFNMLGSPGGSLQEALSTLALNRSIAADHVRINIALPVPGTAFEREAFERGDLTPDYSEKRVSRLGVADTAFQQEGLREIKNLYYLFRIAVLFPQLDPLWHRMLGWGSGELYSPLRFLSALTEKRFSRIGWVEGLRYFRHVGDPRKRTANYVTLI